MSTAPDTEGGGQRLSLALRVFLLFALLIGLALGSAVWITQRQGAEIADQAVARTLSASGGVQSEFTQRRLEELQLKLQVMAAETAFVQYINDASGAGLGLGSAGSDAHSISDLLHERQETFGFDLGIVLDPKAQVLARTDEAEAFAASLGGDRFVEAALKDLKPISGFWRRGDQLYQAAIMPLAQDRDLIGYLLLADKVGNELGKRVSGVSGADVAYLLPTDKNPLVIGSSLDAGSLEALQAALAEDRGGLAAALKAGREVKRIEVSVGGENWVAHLAPLDADGGAILGSSLQLVSLDRITAGYRQILNLVALTGLIALLVALPLSYLLAKATLRPVRAMAQAAQEAASGNYQTRIAIRGNDELARLSHAFDSLLSDLRERKDIEGYVANLSRFLPDPGQAEAVPSFVTSAQGPAPGANGARALEAPKREQLLLLGFEPREAAKPLADEPAEAALERAADAIAGISALVSRTRGEVVAISGNRVVVGFTSGERLPQALALCRSVQDSIASVAAAALEGEIVFGSFNSHGDSLRAALGPTAFQLDRLLSESMPGRLFLPRSLGESVKARLGDAALGVAQGTVSGKSYYAVARESLPLQPPPPEAAPAANGAVAAPPATDAAPTIEAVSHRSGLRPGMRFGGRYEILSVLGEGGMGVVYKARDLELDDVVAIKTLRPSALVDREQLERLKSEIKLARKITHPNVLRTFDFGEAMGLPYISMEYVRGMTLRYLLRQAGRIPYSAALRIARQLCSGLAAAHEVGVLHRDIKPENLILEASGNAKLMDFGIARPIRRAGAGHTQPGMFVGTPQYSAPEQLGGEEVDHRADIYACGVMLCEMFCGKLPFTGANTMEIYMAQMNAQPVKPSALWPEIPKALEALILKCIEPKAEDRVQSANELLDALNALRA